MSHPDVNGGKKRVNHWSLGIEIVNSQLKQPPDSYSDWQVQAAALLIRYCWAKYPNLVHVVSHARMDPGNRSDPGETFPWSRFKELVHDASHDNSRVSSRRFRAISRRRKRSTPDPDICMG
jgi:N-acetylmuramoyl-L-alanine amidase